MQLLTEQGSSGFIEGLRLLVNEAIEQQRATALQALPYERCDARLGHANGFKPNSLATRVGPSKFLIPQVRGGVAVYPSALQKVCAANRGLNSLWPKCMSGDWAKIELRVTVT